MTSRRIPIELKQIISTHTPARGVTWLESLTCGTHPNFNPHSREGSDFFSIKFNYIDFNPHSREGSDLFVFSHPSNALRISTHTPARGVTQVSMDDNGVLDISTHTPARGVTVAIS